MRCSKARDYVSQEIDAILPPDATGKLRDHLDSCADCRQFHEDLLMGQRLLAATEPELPENFEWKLQLKLNQALQQSAGESHYPWSDEQIQDRWVWLRNFGAATAVGLAAVLALAIFFGPNEAGLPGGSVAGNNDSQTVTAVASDRRALFQPSSGGLYHPGAQRRVSAGGGAANSNAGFLDRGWSGSNTEDLITIRRLRVENQRLANTLLQYQHVNGLLRAQLDTSGAEALNLQQEQ